MASTASSGSEVASVDVHEARGLIQTGYVYLDVRTEEEFQKGHPHADNIVNIPYLFITPQGRVKNPEFLKQVASACNKEDHLLVGCQSGRRSLSASVELLADGYKNVKNVGGGYGEWIENQFPVKESNAKGAAFETICCRRD